MALPGPGGGPPAAVTYAMLPRRHPLEGIDLHRGRQLAIADDRCEQRVVHRIGAEPQHEQAESGDMGGDEETHRAHLWRCRTQQREQLVVRFALEYFRHVHSCARDDLAKELLPPLVLE